MVRFRIVGMKERSLIEGAVMTLAKETRLLSLNKSRKRKRPITNRIGEV